MTKLATKEDRRRASTSRADVTDRVPGEPVVAPLRQVSPSKRRRLIDAEIYTAAIQLFSSKGYASTSLQDIADAVGLIRPALYHYISSKEDILGRLVQEFTESKAHEHATVISRSELSPADKLRHMVASTARAVAEHPSRFRLLDRCEGDLPEALKRKQRAAKRAVRDAFVAVLREGVESGHFRPMDAGRAAFGLIGMCTWIAWWFTPSGTADVDATVQGTVDLALNAVLSKERDEADCGGPLEAIHAMRKQLDCLEATVAGHLPSRGGPSSLSPEAAPTA